MVFFYTWGFFLQLRCRWQIWGYVWAQCDLKCKDSIFQEQSSFAKDCRKKGGFFKCCVNSLTLNIFEKSRNSLIREGLIKDTPTSWCKSEGWPEVGRKRKDPCLLCFSDAMCTERDIETGKIKHTFIKEKKKEHGVIWYFTSLFCIPDICHERRACKIFGWV